jgi:hypothetical protein
VRQQLPWAIAAVAGASFVLLVGTSRRGHAVAHPDARPGVNAERVLPPSLVPETPGALEAYAAARSAPQLLDALYCHCQCARNFGHRSLLTCFESDHGSQCDICMGEAMLVTRLAGQGNSLVQIRHAIDQRFGS